MIGGECGECDYDRTPEGHDGCIGTLDGVKNACCGHGNTKEAYVQFDHKDYYEQPNQIRISGHEAIDYINENRQLNIE